jgi:uncharacterized membrane protein YdbT with pleckstrin-like domain
MTICLCVVGIGVVFVAMKWWNNIGSRYELTDQRLIMQLGVIIKRTDEIELFRIKDLRVDYSLLNQMVDIGTITIRSSDATTRGGEYQLHDLRGARQLREDMRNLVDQARRHRGVREVDTDRPY